MRISYRKVFIAVFHSIYNYLAFGLAFTVNVLSFFLYLCTHCIMLKSHYIDHIVLHDWITKLLLFSDHSLVSLKGMNEWLFIRALDNGHRTGNWVHWTTRPWPGKWVQWTTGKQPGYMVHLNNVTMVRNCEFTIGSNWSIVCILHEYVGESATPNVGGSHLFSLRYSC